MYFVYLVICNDNSLYCGITNNLEKRLYEHNNSKKGAKYTMYRRPVKLYWYTIVENKSYALKLEYNIKKMSRKNKLDLIKNICLFL
jgi:putative endonuclease